VFAERMNVCTAYKGAYFCEVANVYVANILRVNQATSMWIPYLHSHAFVHKADDGPMMWDDGSGRKRI
jgi:hypothetical protein